MDRESRGSFGGTLNRLSLSIVIPADAKGTEYNPDFQTPTNDIYEGSPTTVNSQLNDR